MRSSPIFVALATLFAAALVLTPSANRITAAENEAVRSLDKQLPQFETVALLVRRQLATTPHYQPGDLLSQSMVEPLFLQLRQIGWPVADQQAIVKHVPEDSDVVVQALRTEKGRNFMRKMSSDPGGYDRLFRLAALPNGRRLVDDLVRGPGGDKLIQYLTSTPGGKNLGRMLSHTPQGRDFNRPTGSIYTEQDLLQRLQESYRSASAVR